MPYAHGRMAEAVKESRRGLLLAVGRNVTPGEYTTGVASWVLNSEATPLIRYRGLESLRPLRNADVRR